jgi:NADH-quinone oxidoreductase subunit E
MLTREEISEIDEELAHVPNRKAAVIEALKAVQRHRGWVSDEALADVANTLAMTIEEVDAVATFYNLIFRKPVGRHIILICDSVSCWAMGYETLLAHLKVKYGLQLGQTSSDNRFTLLPSACLGACEQAPAMLIDGKLCGNLTPEKIDASLQEYQ